MSRYICGTKCFADLCVISANVKIHPKPLMSLYIATSYEIKVAKIKIYEATTLKIKVANALQFQSSLTALVVHWRQRNLPKNVLHFQSYPASRDFFPGWLLAYTCTKSFASLKAMPGRTFARRVVQSFSFAFFFSFLSSLWLRWAR